MLANLDYSLLERMNTDVDPNGTRQAAGKAFERALSRGQAARLWSRLLRKSNTLPELTSQPVFTRRRASRIVTVPVNQIKGSQGRSADFDAAFNPLHEHNRERWISVATAVMTNVPLSPVDLVQVGEVYYVQDGHHRISVFKALKQEVIEAHIVNA